jgi:hypothetical protein
MGMLLSLRARLNERILVTGTPAVSCTHPRGVATRDSLRRIRGLHGLNRATPEGRDLTAKLPLGNRQGRNQNLFAH